MILQYCLLVLFSLNSIFSSPAKNGTNYYPPEDCGLTNATLYNRLIGAGETLPGEWPWMAYLKVGYSFCGGTLIDSIHILTAAHCVDDSRPVEVLLGDYKPKEGVQEIKRKVVKTDSHPDFKVYWDLPDLPSTNDIAVLTLNEPVPFTDTVHPICLPIGHKLYSGEQATTLGYGAIGPAGPSSDVLREITNPIWDNKACQMRHDRGPVLDSHICFGEPGKGSCHGDSGGPLMIRENGRWYQIGVVGWGREVCNSVLCGVAACRLNLCHSKMCDPAYPTVFARVTSFMPWILTKIKT